MAIAFSSKYVMDAILAWSATHLAQMTGEKELNREMYYHRCRALKGLQAAVKDLSKRESDAALCASIIMAWQATDAYVYL